MAEDELRNLQMQLEDLHLEPPAPKNEFLTCPQCLEKIEVLQNHLGLKLECTLCGHRFKATLRAEQKLQQRLARQQEQEERQRELAACLEQEQREAQERLEELNARGVLPDEAPEEALQDPQPGATRSSRWPFDHRHHHPGWPIRRYLWMWGITALVTAVLWGTGLAAGVVWWRPALEQDSSARLIAMIVFLTSGWLAAAASVSMLSGCIGAIMSHGKGRPHREGFLFGLLLGPLGWILAGLMPNHVE